MSTSFRRSGETPTGYSIRRSERSSKRMSTDSYRPLKLFLRPSAGRLLLHYHRVPGQDASQIQRQYLFEFSHDQGSPFWICFTIERHHASDYLERYVCSKQRLFL